MTALLTWLAELEAAEGRMQMAPWDADGEYVFSGRNQVHLYTERKSITLLRNRAKALCGMVRIAVEALDKASASLTACAALAPSAMRPAAQQDAKEARLAFRNIVAIAAAAELAGKEGK